MASIATRTPCGTRTRWQRLLVPSMTDVLFLALIFWPLMTSGDGWGNLLTDTNTGLHIRTGDYVLATGGVPHTDLYSFSRPGEDWYAFEWLTCTLYSLLYRAFDFRGILVVTALAFSLFAVTMLRDSLQRGGGLFISLALALVAFRASAIHYHARPHVFTLMFVAIAVWLIDRDRRRGGRAIWLLAPLAVVWTNMHGGFLTLPVYLALLAAGTLAESWWGRQPLFSPAARRYALFSLVTAAASLVNPYGLRLHVHIAEFLGSSWLREIVQEYQPTRFDTESTRFYAILLVLGLVVAVAQLRRRRVAEPLILAFFGYSSLMSARHIPIFAAVAVPILAVEITRLWTVWWQNRAASPFRSLGLTISALQSDFRPAFLRSSQWIVVLALVLLACPLPMTWPTDFDPEQFPVRVASRNSDLLTSGRLFTLDNWGDYLIWRNYPKQRVLVDGRSDFYGQQIGLDYLAICNDWDGGRELFEQYGFDRILMPVDHYLVQRANSDSAWTEVDRDPVAVLLVRRASPAAAHRSGSTIRSSSLSRR